MKEIVLIRSLDRDLSHSAAAPLLERFVYPWEVLPHIAEFILQHGETLSAEQYDRVGKDIWIAKSAHVAPSAALYGPCIIGEGAEIRHCAFLRGNVIVGKGAVVGNSTELKNCILFDGVQVPHYNYVGDSILGYRAHMGAGAITSNVKSDKTEIRIRCGEDFLETGLRKCGAMLGDGVEVGCNSVLNPGTVICPNSNVYPLSSVRGIVPSDSIFKNQSTIVKKH